MDETYNNEDFLPNAQPEVIFDNDTDGTDASTTLGYNLSTVWSTDPEIIPQYRTATDYLGLHSLLTSLGFSDANAHTILLPKQIADRDRNPGTALDSIAAPSGAASAWDNWPIEFRRLSNPPVRACLRMGRLSELHQSATEISKNLELSTSYLLLHAR